MDLGLDVGYKLFLGYIIYIVFYQRKIIKQEVPVQFLQD